MEAGCAAKCASNKHGNRLSNRIVPQKIEARLYRSRGESPALHVASKGNRSSLVSGSVEERNLNNEKKAILSTLHRPLLTSW